MVYASTEFHLGGPRGPTARLLRRLDSALATIKLEMQ